MMVLQIWLSYILIIKIMLLYKLIMVQNNKDNYVKNINLNLIIYLIYKKNLKIHFFIK